MTRTADYIILTLLSVALVLLFVKPMVEKTAESLVNSATMIQEATGQ